MSAPVERDSSVPKGEVPTMWDLFTIRLTKLVRRLGKDIHRMLTTINNSSSTKEQLTDVAKEIKRNMELYTGNN